MPATAEPTTLAPALVAELRAELAALAAEGDREGADRLRALLAGYEAPPPPPTPADAVVDVVPALPPGLDWRAQCAAAVPAGVRQRWRDEAAHLEASAVLYDREYRRHGDAHDRWRAYVCRVLAADWRALAAGQGGRRRAGGALVPFAQR